MSMPHNRAARSAFTLVELLIVILIIAVVIAIALPALGMARIAAKRASSQMLANNLGAAINTFESEKRRQPGYFSAAEMGAPENGRRGFTTLENVMLDLAGGLATASPGASTVDVGPIAGETVLVDLDLIGADSQNGEAYFTPDPKNYIAQNGSDGGLQAGEQEHQDLPDVVDAFGSPVLLWMENPATRATRVQAANGTGPGVPFALIDSGSGQEEAARYYWNSNAGFLNSKRLGSMSRSQVQESGANRFSLISNSKALKPEVSLMGLLGSPSNANVDVQGVSPNETVPGASRGAFTVHMAGPDGMYLSSRDDGAARFSTNVINYWQTWYVGPRGPRLTDDEGKVTSQDLIVDQFDDFLLSGGN